MDISEIIFTTSLLSSLISFHNYFCYVCVRNLCILDKAWSSGRCSIPDRSLFHHNLLHLALAFSRRSPSFTDAYSAPYSVTVDNSKSREENKKVTQQCHISGWLLKQIIYVFSYQLKPQFLLMPVQMSSYWTENSLFNKFFLVGISCPNFSIVH